MNGGAYYNEIDPYCVEWLRNLIAAGHIAPGDVDERSIADVQPDDLRGYTQCHFFAGIAGWSLALRLAGWPDDRPVWSGSCPCPPFSSAGKKFRCPRCNAESPIPNAVRTGAFNCIRCDHEWQADERHLWPEFFRLIRECRPERVFGEQVASADGRTWLDVVLASLEMVGYATWPADLPACSVGAPHIRQRLWFVANANGAGTWRNPRDAQCAAPQGDSARREDRGNLAGISIAQRATSELANADGRNARAEGLQRSGEYRQREKDGCPKSVAFATSDGRLEGCCQRDANDTAKSKGRHGESCGSITEPSTMEHPESKQVGLPRRARQSRDAGVAQGDTNGARRQIGTRLCGNDAETERQAGRQAAIEASPWHDLIWLPCTDGKQRPTQSGIFPLAHGLSARVGRLRAAGNAITPQCAAEFIRASAEAIA